MQSDKNWVRTDPRSSFSWEEQRPYEACPNCGRYEYRKLRMFHAGIIRCILLGKDSYYTVYSACKHCKYKTEREKVDETE